MTRETKRPETILIVDDTPQNLDLLTRMLGEKGYQIRSAISGRIALDTARLEPPDLVLLDINMPEMDGFEVCKRFKKEKPLKHIPIIFLTVMSETTEKIKAFEAGGVDYITKPFEPREVESRIRTHLLIREQQRQLIESEKAKYYNIFDNAVEGIFQALADGTIITANYAFSSMLGYKDPHEINLSRNYFVEERSFDELKSIILENRGKVERFEAQANHKNGESLWVSMKVRSYSKNVDTIVYEGMVENITGLKKAENEIKLKSARLEEINSALNVLLEKIKESSRNEHEMMYGNIRNFVLPYVSALKNMKINEKQKEYLELIEAHLFQITSPLIHNLRQFDLTPTEIEVANLIKEGRSTKEIARLLNKSKTTVDFHRYKVRKKLGINNQRSNLQSYLLGIEDDEK